MQYVYIDPNTNRTVELVPVENPALPGFPIEKRYPQSFIDNLIQVSDDFIIEGYQYYNKDTGEFYIDIPPEPEVPETPDPPIVEESISTKVDSNTQAIEEQNKLIDALLGLNL